jgi:diguanylate cyclase (GGDEF)-like protein/PAS domain S-box-containing protein
MSDQARLQMALEAANMAVWDSTIVNGCVIQGSVIWSGSGAALLGLDALPLTHSFSDFLKYVHVEDQDRVVKVLQDGADRCASYSIEYRVVWPDGTVRWLSAKARVFCRADGTPDHTLGIIWDITEQMLNEILVEERRELAEITLGSIGDGVITTDAQGRTGYMNRVAEQLTGWTNAQALGQDICDTLVLIDEVTGEALENVAVKCLRLRQAVGISSRSLMVTRDGKQIAVEDSAAPIWSRNGEIMGAVIVFHDVSHERKLHKEMSWQATHDTLTGLINRREFETQVAAALHSAKTDRHVHALLYLDLDQFKVVNDTSGHVAGDLLLQTLAKSLQNQLRDSDILARLGGDELGVLLPHCPLERSTAIAEQLRKSVKDFRFVWDSRTFELGVSIGLVEINADSKSMTELLIAADQACYLAKEQGRNKVCVYHESDVMLAQRHGEMLWVTRLNEAFESKSFRLYVMPIVHLRDPVDWHEEVLIRIQNMRGDIILPGAFIPAAERYDLMPSIDRWVIQGVCRHIQQERDDRLSKRHGEGGCQGAPIVYSINLSGISLRDADLHNFIVEEFERYAIRPEQICFEITETAVIANLSNAQLFMSKLKHIGCRFSLDDFGSGLSSFAYLKTLPVDYLKIDGVFVRDIAINPINRAMVRAINEVGHVMGLRTVAEYVEDEQVLDIVRDIGLDYAQGYAIGHVSPMVARA